MMPVNLSDIAISNIKVADYCSIISGINKNVAINLSKYQFDWKNQNIIIINCIITYKNG